MAPGMAKPVFPPSMSVSDQQVKVLAYPVKSQHLGGLAQKFGIAIRRS